MYNGPYRKKLRLKDYDYSQDGYYFVTICTKDRECYFGEIIEGKMILHEYGKIAENEIVKTEGLRKEIKIDEFIIMPNHIHLLIVIKNNDDDMPVGYAGLHTLPQWQQKTKNKLSNVIQRIKSSITLNIRKQFDNLIFAWQKSFFDVIIKNNEQFNKTKEYIINNPLKWELDNNNPKNTK